MDLCFSAYSACVSRSLPLARSALSRVALWGEREQRYVCALVCVCVCVGAIAIASVVLSVLLFILLFAVVVVVIACNRLISDALWLVHFVFYC